MRAQKAAPCWDLRGLARLGIAVTIGTLCASGARAQTHDDTAMRSEVALTGRAAVSGNDGSVSYAFQFPLPPTRGHFQPSLALTYNSGATKGNIVGLGWSLTANYIEQSTRALAAGGTFPSEQYWLVQNGSRVMLAPAGGSPPTSFSRVVGDSYLAITFDRTASAWTATDAVGSTYKYKCLAKYACTRWYLTDVTDVDGNVVHYDYTPETQTCDWKTETELGDNVDGGPQVLTAISYNNVGTAYVHTIQLTYIPNPQPETEATPGACAVVHDKNLSNVTITRRTSGTTTYTTLGSYDLAYLASPDSGRQLLASIQPKGRDGTAFGEPTRFAYNDPSGVPASLAAGSALAAPGGAAPSMEECRFLLEIPADRACKDGRYPWSGIHYYGGCSASDVATWIDMDGDGRPDLVWGGGITGTGTQAGIRWARNLSTPGNPSFAAATVIAGSGSWRGVVSSLHPSGEVAADSNRQGGPGPNAKISARILDFNGDGLPDLVSDYGSRPSDSLCTTTQYDVRFGSVDSQGNLTFVPRCVDVSVPFANAVSALTTPDYVSYVPLKELVDVTGDGIVDMLVDTGTSTPNLYPGYRVGDSYAVGSLHFLTGPSGPCGGSLHCAGAASTDYAAGSIIQDTFDADGDGIPDRVYFQHLTNALPEWVVAPGTGMGFGSRLTRYSGNLARPMYWVMKYVIGYDVNDMEILASRGMGSTFQANADGAVDFIAEAAPYGSATTCTGMVLGIRRPSGWAFDSSTCLAQPAGFPTGAQFRIQDHATFSTRAMTSLCTDAAENEYFGSGQNEQFVDVDGDGLADYVFADAQAHTWQWFRNTRAFGGDLLASVTTPAGLVTSFKYSPSTYYTTVAQQGPPRAVVYQMTRSGPGVPLLDQRFGYANPIVAGGAPFRDSSQVEFRGYADTYTALANDPSPLGVRATHTNWDGRFQFLGRPGIAEAGYSAMPAAAVPGAVLPSFTATARQTWTLGWRDGNGCQTGSVVPLYPAVPYVVTADSLHQEAGSQGPVWFTSRVQNACVDTSGNVPQTTTIPDTSDTGSTSQVTEYRVFPATGASPCAACAFEVYALNTSTGATDTSDLYHRFFHYDGAAARRTPATKGHVSWVEELVSGTGDSGVYEVAATRTYNADGTLASVTRSYQGQDVSSVTQSYSYDPNVGLEVTRIALTDNTPTNTSTVTLWTDFGYDPGTGLLNSTFGPYLAGASPSPRKDASYDVYNRVVAAGLEGNTIAAYEYALPAPPTTSSGSWTFGSVTSYSFASNVPFPPPFPISVRDDINQTITYADAAGRSIQHRSRLGTGITASAGAQVVQPLATNFLVSGATRYDGLGRVTASLDPYYSSTSAAADFSTDAASELGLPGLHASRISYDDRGRALCGVYGPISGSIPAAPTTASACVSNFASNSSYLRATWSGYGAESLSGRAYAYLESEPDWENVAGSTKTPPRQYYDAAGRLLFARDQYQNFTAITRDALGRELRSVRYAGTVGATPNVADVKEFDKRGRITKETDTCAEGASTASCRVRFFSYLPTGEILRATQGPTTYTPPGEGASGVEYHYGTLGRLASVSNRVWGSNGAGYSVTLTPTAQYHYDVPYVQGSGYAYEAGRVSWANNADVGTIAYGYDAAGRTTQRNQWFTGRNDPASGLTVARTYRPDGQILATAVNAVTALTYYWRYDSAGRLVKVDDGAGTVFWETGGSTTGAYDALGRLTAANMDSGWLTQAYAYDPSSNAMTSMSTRTNSAPYGSTTSASLSSSSFTFAGDKLTGSSDGVTGSSFTFSYDRDGRLSHATASAGNCIATVLTQCWDVRTSMFAGATPANADSLTSALASPSAWNLTLASGTGITSWNYNYDASATENLVSTTDPTSSAQLDTFTYDANHLLTQDAMPDGHRVQFAYDAQSRLSTISRDGTTEESLFYGPSDSLGRRSLPNETRWYGGADFTLLSSSLRGNVHIYAGAKRVATVSVVAADTSTMYYVYDRQGGVIATATHGGGGGSQYRYDPYGNRQASEVAGAQSELGYTGGLQLSESLIHLNARVYNPRLRQFLQPDNVDALRRSYAEGDPQNGVDPSGHRVVKDHERHTFWNTHGTLDYTYATTCAGMCNPFANWADAALMAAALSSRDPANVPKGVAVVGLMYGVYLPLTWRGGTLTIYSSGTHDGSAGSGGLSGHSWIAFTPEVGEGQEGETVTYGTWGSDPGGSGNGLHEDLEKGRPAGSERSASLSMDQIAQLFVLINEYAGRGADGWGISYPCSTFAAEAWRAGSGEWLSPYGPYSNPSSLLLSIIEANR